jgi:beta-phosphoglucomutase-like phosphatase (HAD superfamily)
MNKFNANKSECIIIEDLARDLKSTLVANINCMFQSNDFFVAF